MFEESGISTVVISVWKELIELVRPPRALVVRGQFGSPMGMPGDVVQQTAILREALSLIDGAQEPGVVVELDQ